MTQRHWQSLLSLAKTTKSRALYVMFGFLRSAARRVAWGRASRRGALVQSGCHTRNSRAWRCARSGRHGKRGARASTCGAVPKHVSSKAYRRSR